MLKKSTLAFLRNNLSLISLLFAGSVSWSLTMVKSGLNYSYGLGFWGPNGHDGIWHLAIIERLSKFSLASPVFAGEPIRNYHLGFDLLAAFLYKLTGISINTLYFQILPIIFSLLIGLLVYKFVVKWRGSKKEALWSLFFVYFGSGFGFIITFLRSGVITGESMFWSQQALSTLVNPPFALSLIFILSGFIFLINYLKNKHLKDIILSSLFLGLLIQIKSYAGVLILLGLGVSSLWQLIKNKEFTLFKVLILSSLISFVIFFPFIKESSKMLVFQPFWFLETMMTYSDRLGWERFYSAMTTYKMGKIWLKEILAYSTAFVIFLVGNMGSRILGFYVLVKIIKKEIKLGGFEVFVLSIIFFAVAIPMFFVQKGTPWNTIQFFYYFLFFFSLFAGISLSGLLNKTKFIFKRLLLILVLTFAFLGGWSTLRHYLPSTPPAKLSNEEYKALKFLAKQPDGVVLTYPFDSFKSKEAELNAPRPLYLYVSSAYVSAFSKKTVFLEDEVNLDITGYDWKTRREEVSGFISNLDVKKGRDFLETNYIKYLYLAKAISPLPGERLRLGEGQLGLKNIFENLEVVIYKVK
ncbi:MAG: hypothetical protein Q8P91_03065 [bacterium]|nr:hypothetical protein [bacterium]